MEKALITFANGETVEIKENEYITPVSKTSYNDESFASQAESIEICSHIHFGLIPAIASVLCCYSHFFIGTDTKTLYSSSSVVKVEAL